MPATGIMVGRRASVVFERFMKVVFLSSSVDVGVLEDRFGRSSMLSVDGETEVDGLKVGAGAADVVGKTLLSNGEYNIDMYTRRGYISLKLLNSSGAASFSFFTLLYPQLLNCD